MGVKGEPFVETRRWWTCLCGRIGRVAVKIGARSQTAVVMVVGGIEGSRCPRFGERK